MRKVYWRMGLIVLVALTLCEAGNARAFATGGERRSSLGTISGTVLDSRGNPLGGVLVAVLRDGLNEVVKETRSAADGSFSTRVTPGRYLIRALAEGFSPATFTAVAVGPSSELVYRFNLQPAGEGRTAPERRADRNDPKFKIRAAQSRRSVFQNNEGEDKTADAAMDAVAKAESEAALGVEGDAAETQAENQKTGRGRTQGFVETFYAASANPRLGNYHGLNFAVAAPVKRQFDMVFAGQLGEFERLEATARVRAGVRHRLSATLGGARLPLGSKVAKFSDDKLGQMSVRAIDEWIVRDGVVVVLGLDYSRFVGAGNAHSLTPRFGVQFDANARTRVRAAYAPGTDSTARVQNVETFEDSSVAFKEPTGQAVALVDGKAIMERSHRLEFGVERVLDDSSSVEASAFFDTTDGRGVGLLSMPLAAFSSAANGETLMNIANQQGGARGLRVVYTRRISSRLKTSAGYAFGRGQRLSPEGITNPENLFQNAYFQTAAAQVDANVFDGTTVRTVLRFSSRASIFAIDPFAGRVAVYDPSLSILVTQELPNFGLPVRAQATLDARNLLDVLTSTDDGESQLSVGAARRTVRGGISVRF
ncbi:MAG: TonB-dependent receptor [Acidobacteria bacterium]|nr:TonB-dependent receptor [Acidobacteriota bacterium]